MKCALSGIAYCRPVFRPRTVSTMNCLRAAPANGVRSMNRRAGLTTRIIPFGG